MIAITAQHLDEHHRRPGRGPGHDRPYDGWLMKQGGSWEIDRWEINVDRQLDEPAD